MPGGTSDTSCTIRDPSIKTFADYEQKSLIEPNADFAVALVRCDDVTHYIFNDWGGDAITFETGNTVTITKLIKTGGPGNLFEENMQIEFMQQYGYRPGEDSESLKDYLDQELGLTSKMCIRDRSTAARALREAPGHCTWANGAPSGFPEH